MEKKQKFKPKQPVKTKKLKNLCQKQKVIFTNKNWLALFVKVFDKKVNQFGLFEYVHCVCMKIVVFMKSNFYENNLTPSI